MADETPNSELFDKQEGVVPVQTKAQKRQQKKSEREAKQAKRTPKPIQPRTASQAAYIESLTDNDLTFGIGPFGVGKTYVAAHLFGGWLASGRIDKLYVARPNIAKKKHENGFLPGTLEEKTAPWLVPIFDGIKDSMGPSVLEELRRSKKIEEVPFEFIQGRTLKDAACIIDEAENLDLDDFYITLGRQGENLSMCIAGDIRQSRIPDSGLGEVVNMARKWNIPSTGVVEFSSDDIVRSAQARYWAQAFEAHFGNNKSHSDSNYGETESDAFLNDLPAFLKGDT